MHKRHRKREAETQAEGEAGSMLEARSGTRSWDSGITPWAKGRGATAEPPRHTSNNILNPKSILVEPLMILYWFSAT